MPASAALQAQRRQNGLCPLDDKPSAPHVFCAHHRARRVRLNMAARARRSERMVCRNEGCGNTPAAGNTMCVECVKVAALKAKARADAKAANGICVMNGCKRRTANRFRVCARCRMRRRFKYAAAD